MVKTRKRFRRSARWVAIVCFAMLCTLLLLLIIFPVRFIDADRQGHTEVSSATKVPPHSLLGFSELSREEQIKRYIEWRRQDLQEQIQKQICARRDHFIIESVKSFGRGVYIVDLSKGKYIFIVFNNKIILKVKLS